MAKKVYGMYFSGTGTTKKMVTYIASELAKKLAQSMKHLTLLLPQQEQTEKLLKKTIS